MKPLKSLLLVLTLFLPVAIVSGQESIDMKNTAGGDKVRRNVVRLNLTNPLIFGDRSLVLGYERVLNDHQSFSINGGLASLPKFNLINIVDDSIVQLYKDSKDRGFNLTGDYRFYLASENKYRAPRGLYIGPYASHVFMGRENSWHLDTDNFNGDVKTDLKFNMTAVGAQLGYQFILWKRVALDFVLIGPSIAWYSLSAKLDTTLDPEDESALYDKINEILEDRFPGYTFAFDGVDFKKTGTTDTQSYGFRYTIHLGYHF
jgi:hypothetical protein